MPAGLGIQHSRRHLDYVRTTRSMARLFVLARVRGLTSQSLCSQRAAEMLTRRLSQTLLLSLPTAITGIIAR